MKVIDQVGLNDNTLVLPSDKLSHQKLSENILRVASNLPEGSVIAIEGSWGRGKSDVWWCCLISI